MAITAQDIINEAKSIYPVELSLPPSLLASLVNSTRERVNRLANIAYTAYSLQIQSNTYHYILPKSFYRIYRCNIVINGIQHEMHDILEGKFILDSNQTGTPAFFSFRPMKDLFLYPTPNNAYIVNVYGLTMLDLIYSNNNLDEVDSQMPDHMLHALGIELAKRFAEFDQQYELAGFLETQFLAALKEMKV